VRYHESGSVSFSSAFIKEGNVEKTAHFCSISVSHELYRKIAGVEK
jgi:hypothetical protein